MGVKLHEAVQPDGTHHSWLFHCPACGTIHGCDKRWSFNGNVESPTFDGSVLVHPSLYLRIGRPLCHSFVRGGRIQYLGDCTHAMANQTVDLPDWKGFSHDEGP